MIPQGYSCGDTFSQTPVGLVGDKVTAYYHAVYGSVKNAENMKRSLLRSGIELAGYEPHPIAAALAVSTEATATSRHARPRHGGRDDVDGRWCTSTGRF